MGKTNREWHEAHRMPPHPSERQRAEWHYQHALSCGCREITPSISKLLETQGFAVPTQRPPESASS